MANKDFKVKNGLDIQSPLPVSMGGTGQTSTTNTLNSLLPAQAGNTNKVLQTDGTNTTWVTLPSGYTKGGSSNRPGSPSLGDIHSNTDTGYIEVYTAQGWSQLGVIPMTPTIGTATDNGSGISYGSTGIVSVAFTPNASGGLPSSYTVTSTSGGFSATGSSSPISVTGLNVGTSYTFTVTATNGYGNSLASTSSNSVTPSSIAQSPTITGVVAGDQSASVSFTSGNNGSKTITNYKYSLDNNIYTAFSPAQTSSPLVISGLTNGNSYTVRIKAVNANGDSSASSASSSFIPSVPPTWVTTQLDPWFQSTAYSYQLSATVVSGSSATYSLVSGSFPSGISMNSSGLISGTTSASLTYSSLVIRATNETGAYSDKTLVFAGATKFSYTGASQTYSIPTTGKYAVRVYGARGGDHPSYRRGGAGGYSYGEINLTSGQTIYCYVGGWTTSLTAGWNGGGTGGQYWYGGGGGATDFRTSTSLNDRFIVAGGGGGSAISGGGNGGAGGGLEGSNGQANNGVTGMGGTQTAGGSRNGSFGQGGNGSNNYAGGAGGGGWYGGGGSNNTDVINNSGGGGSGYIGGVSNGYTETGGHTGDHGWASIAYIGPS